MNDVLTDISRTPLEGPVKYVDTQDECTKCGGIKTYYGHPPKAINCRLGATHTDSCPQCADYTCFKVIKVTPSKDQTSAAEVKSTFTYKGKVISTND